MEHRTDISPTNYSSVYEQLLEFPSKLDEPELEKDYNLEEFSENWATFLNQETPRELKEDYPLELDEKYLEDQYQRLEKTLEENLYEYAAIEFSSFFEEIVKRFEMQENPFSEEYEHWLNKDCWTWRESAQNFFSKQEYEAIDDLYSIRNWFLHDEEEMEKIKENSQEKLAEIIPIYNQISPHRIDISELDHNLKDKRDYKEMNKLIKSDLEEYASFLLFRNLVHIESEIDFDYLEELMPAARYSDENRNIIEYNEDVEKIVAISPKLDWMDEKEVNEVRKTIEYRKEQAHNIEPNKNAPSIDDIDWSKIAEINERLDKPIKELIKSTTNIDETYQNKLAKSYIVSEINNLSQLEEPENNVMFDTTLPFNSKVRSKINSVINERANSETIDEVININWKNRVTSLSTSSW